MKNNQKLACDLISLVANAIATNTIAEAQDYLAEKYNNEENPLITHAFQVLTEISNKK